MRIHICFAFLCLTLASGCATVTRGTSETFVIETEPVGASVQSSTGWSCTTPCSMKVKRRGDFTLTVEREGYETVQTAITSSVDGAGAAGMAGNVLVGGIIGAGIDAGTGAMHSHKPNPLVLKLVPESATGEGDPAPQPEIVAESAEVEADPVLESDAAAEAQAHAEPAASDTAE